MTTNVTKFIEELDAGVFEEKLSRALSEVAAGVIDHNKPGKVTVTLDLKRIGDSYQVAVDHKLAFVRPTARGKVTEENSTKTPMHVGKQGRLSLFPEDQTQMFDMHGKVNDSIKE